MFVKPTSSRACTALSADSASASGDGQPYLSSSGRSNEPPLTPTRSGIPRPFTALMTSSTFHQAPILPGLMRTQSTISAAFKANRWSKWMSAMSGTVIAALMLGSAAAASSSGTATRISLASGRLELPNLLDRRRHIARIGRTHRLDRNRRVAADLHFADLNLPGWASA